MNKKSVTSDVYALKKFIKKKIRYGTPIHIIEAAAIGEFGQDLGIEEVRETVRQEVENFGDYELIQMVMRSKIVQEIDGRQSLILDHKTRQVTAITRERLIQLLNPALDISEKFYTCRFVYDPFRLKQIYKNDSGTWEYNSYKPPAWQAETFYSQGEVPIKPETEVPTIYQRFFNHLVDGDRKSLNYVLDWLATAIQGRNYCILATIGTYGVGKGTLGEIMEKLVGEDNYASTGNRILAERFNAQIKDKRIVYCDEASVKDQKQEERLKVLVNNALEIEAKGKDAERIVNHASFYFSSNNLDSINLDHNDRRFSIVNLTDVKLKKVFKISEIKSLTAPENIDLLARYLMFRKVDQSSMLDPFISRRTHEIRKASLSGWNDWILDEYAIDNAGKTIVLRKVADDIESLMGSKYKPSRQAFEKLQAKYPQHLKVWRPTIEGKQVYAITFPNPPPPPRQQDDED